MHQYKGYSVMIKTWENKVHSSYLQMHLTGILKMNIDFMKIFDNS